ncbi:MAG TPA: PBP1A family penicillin-binding protein [Polyangiales bacterium]|nr:PBP1A family penicillin-binding protein [Polyangiales bacterium]
MNTSPGFPSPFPPRQQPPEPPAPPPPPEWPRRPENFWKRWLQRIPPKWKRRAMFAGAGALGSIVLAVIVFFGVIFYFGRDLPPIEALKNYAPVQTSRVVDRKGRMIAEWFTERRTVVPMSRVPRVLVLSVLAAEDADFYQHAGFDYAGIVRALLRDVTQGKARQGASTITQQIVKTMLLTPERTISRKIRELILARRLEQELTKDEILGLYLNHINFGHGRYGVEEASRFYFGKHVDQLDLSEASLIAGVPQSPARLSPISHPDNARKRQLFVLSQLEAKRAQYWDDLSVADIQKARDEPARLRTEPEPAGIAPEVATLAREALSAQVGEDAAKRGGFTLQTGVDLDLQALCRKALRDGLIRIDERQKLQAPLKAPNPTKKKDKDKLAPLPRIAELAAGRNYDATVRGADAERNELILDIGGHPARATLKGLERWNPKGLDAQHFAEVGALVRVSLERVDALDTPAQARLMLGPQGAMVMIDPRTRDILALVGGDEAIYGFNRATQAVRQPGSTWKPIEYALAMEQRKFTPASVVLDAPEVYDEWKPNNYETWRYTGAVRLREALAQSINLVAVRVTAEVTPQAVVDFAHKLGISSELDPSLALALGASGVKPIELINAYTSFAAGGRYEPARLIQRMRDAQGKDIPLPERHSEQVLTPEGAYLITSLMTSVVQGGTAKALAALQRPIAGKTGTSNKVRDAWFVGFTPEVVAGIWLGYDDLRGLGKGESGANSAVPIWMEVMKTVLKDAPAVDFPVPPGIEVAKIDPKSGKLAYDGQPDAIDEVFLEGTVPTEVANPPDVVDTGSFIMEQQGGG